MLAVSVSVTLPNVKPRTVNAIPPLATVLLGVSCVVTAELKLNTPAKDPTMADTVSAICPVPMPAGVWHRIDVSALQELVLHTPAGALEEPLPIKTVGVKSDVKKPSPKVVMLAPPDVGLFCLIAASMEITGASYVYTCLPVPTAPDIVTDIEG